ncbi:hypothetical protein BAUCODRAFT_33517 [Baudoinia panamericana UAMH 10762]|uniref:Uncharacterized protein n=1 Tax=Baudoinia panamericana (strain UAMH 10762) TaxID=717646 RepID=M2MHS4_BAUPA|nr:uncharacterized protein BAUCODRAFT_33517 [Baudoinia panamericana UAMH 10762]EMC96176.1 hypothetical protein BAUCODRAFT_33517 [Baudoinia panamericana UAMH 10762]
MRDGGHLRWLTLEISSSCATTFCFASALLAASRQRLQGNSVQRPTLNGYWRVGAGVLIDENWDVVPRRGLSSELWSRTRWGCWRYGLCVLSSVYNIPA